MVRGHNNSYARLIRGKRRDRARKKEDTQNLEQREMVMEDRIGEGNYKGICVRDGMGYNNLENN